MAAFLTAAMGSYAAVGATREYPRDLGRSPAFLRLLPSRPRRNGRYGMGSRTVGWSRKGAGAEPPVRPQGAARNALAYPAVHARGPERAQAFRLKYDSGRSLAW